METYPCSRCDGKGRIDHHNNVLGGVCFKCGGSGQQKSNPIKQHPFQVFATERDTGAQIPVFTIGARDESTALKKAKTVLARGTGYIPESARVEAYPKISRPTNSQSR